jgi:hypothetical protein
MMMTRTAIPTPMRSLIFMSFLLAKRRGRFSQLSPSRPRDVEHETYHHCVERKVSIQ